MDIFKMIQKLQQSGFYGSLEAIFQNGHVVLLRQTQTYKPDPVPQWQEERGIECQDYFKQGMSPNITQSMQSTPKAQTKKARLNLYPKAK